MIRFELAGTDAATGVRYGEATTPHGSFRTPAFMPVGTQATVKSQTPRDLEEAGVEILLVNAYHMEARPGSEHIRSLGGLHDFMGWSGPILTDSGGYQIFSLADCVKKSENGVIFQCHIDGRRMEYTPEHAMKVQQNLGTDIAMAFDDCPAFPCPPAELRRSVDRTIRWAERCRSYLDSGSPPALFGIVQGGIDPDLRAECAREIRRIGFDGYAIGGLCVGEPIEDMRNTVRVSCEHLPSDSLRYLMGVGTPHDLLAGVEAGVDMFDCVMPTRSARNALAFTSQGLKRMRNAQWAEDLSPLDPECPCVACTRFSIAYLRHLYISKEMLAGILVSTHNITFYERLLQGARRAAQENRFAQFRDDWLARWNEATERAALSNS